MKEKLQKLSNDLRSICRQMSDYEHEVRKQTNKEISLNYEEKSLYDLKFICNVVCGFLHAKGVDPITIALCSQKIFQIALIKEYGQKNIDNPSSEDFDFGVIPEVEWFKEYFKKEQNENG